MDEDSTLYSCGTLPPHPSFEYAYSNSKCSQPTRATFYVLQGGTPYSPHRRTRQAPPSTSWHAFVIPWVVAHAFAVLPVVSVALRHLQAAPATIPHHANPFSLRSGACISSATTVFITTSLRPSSPKATMNVIPPRRPNVANFPNVAEPEQVHQLGTQIDGGEILPPSVLSKFWSKFKAVASKVM